MLDRKAFEHRLDHQVAISEVGQVRAAAPLSHDLWQLLRGQLAALDALAQEGLGLAACTVQRLLAEVEHASAEACACADDGNAGTHGAGTSHADGLDLVHEFSLNRSAPQKTASHELPVNLVRAFPDLRDLRVAHQPFHPEVLAVPIAAEQLHRIGGSSHCEIARPHLQQRGFDAEIGRAPVDPTPNLPQEAFHERKLSGQLRDHELDALEFEDATPGMPSHFPNSRYRPAPSPLVMKVLLPLTTISPPSSRNEVRMPVASEPAPGSVMASAPKPPCAMRGSNRCFWPSVPQSMRGFMAW